MEDLASTAKKLQEKKISDKHLCAKKLTAKYSKPERLVNDKDGKSITIIEGQSYVWVEHFQELLKRQAPLNPPWIKETRMVIRQIKSGKAA
ncbi:unnamed protein product [Schistosoma curassoni]|uniref:NTR domain-containing protein n=1 Tax=Schistosoma curassoni TaxID=6186 RepID=A0A183KP46_9TREM|nr:unnamed protein product [Schistosoma curassoni]